MGDKRPIEETVIGLFEDQRSDVEDEIDRTEGDSLAAVIRDSLDEYIESGGLEERRWRDDDG